MNEALTRARIFEGLSPDVVAAAVRQLEWVSFPARHNVFRAGDVGERLYIITAGRVKVGHTAERSSGLIAVLGPADIFGELALLDPCPRASTVTTITAVRAAVMTRPALREWMRQEPQAAEQMLRVLARRLRRTNNILCDQAFNDVAGRLAKLLLDLANRFGETDNGTLRIDHQLNQTEIAQLAGSTRESANKALASFVDRGWIRVQGRVIHICDPASLAKRAR
ncbi:Crp/Fnr family transcriptional regulator [Mycobacterium sp. CBMA 234]|uniref:Crp/Fnr family transcriptional regulator n=1 Tax=Mycolicibacterium sp. CBMA 234 TaxID=1918495 RepID=UPI0012DC899B|nr:Crp/Fnr family transcriptional regulator [Mycolicibacterium sp. CBMA 234]MUL64073.1 Crp/Fnr family transcriptional regulator [Mycolicibacterium sp. CBMA 234]